MSGDYTKFSFKSKKNYSGVYKQQGRVSLDSDWNEQAEIKNRRWRSETIDIIGECVVPESTSDGFRVMPTGPGTFDIGIGRAYVDGIQTECHGLDPQRYDAVLGEEQGTLPVPYTDQPHLPAPLPQSLTAPVLPPITDRKDLIYLDVWQREVTVIEDPGIKEIALGGPDTTTRIQTAWQVKAITDVGDVSCPDEIPGWDDETRPSGGRLTTSTHVPPPDDNPCIISAAGGYRGIENRLYRVEVHTPGGLGTAKFKWSRNNASIVTSVTGINTDRITVESTGRDEILRFNVGDWVEITDDHREYQSLHGCMAQVTSIDEANRIITVNNPVPAFYSFDATNALRHTRIRRWDQSEGLDTDGLLLVPTNATDMVDIEDGIRVSFDLDSTITDGEFKIGDYWVFHARTADGSVEPLENTPPRGIKHHYCRLALVTWGDDIETTRANDCRTIWPPAHCCPISVRPGEDVQAAINRVPPEGGCVCLLPGIHAIHRPLLIDSRKNLTITGTGPASKLVFDPITKTEKGMSKALLYVVGASRNIDIHSLFIHADALAHLIFVDEASEEITVENCILINGLSDNKISPDCILLGECCKVTAAGSKLVGGQGIVQASVDVLTQSRAALSILRPSPDVSDEEEDHGTINNGEKETGPVEISTLHGLQIGLNEIFFTDTGVELQDVLEGDISQNGLHSIEMESLAGFARQIEQIGEDGMTRIETVFQDFYSLLEQNLAALSSCPKSDETGKEETKPGESEEVLKMRRTTIGIFACLMEDFKILDNSISAQAGIVLEHSRQVRIRCNNIKAGSIGIAIQYGFDAGIEDNIIRITTRDDLAQKKDVHDLWKAYRQRFDSGRPGIGLRFVRGIEIKGNQITGQSGIGILRKNLKQCNGFRADSLLRVLGIERPWRVLVELAWFLYQIIRMVSTTAARAADESPSDAAVAGSQKDAFGRRMFEWFTKTLSSRYLPCFIGKAIIADNRMQVSRFGIFLYKITSIGGLRIMRNRISGFHKTGILVHHWFSAGLVDTYARIVRCLIEWIITFLTLLRDALAKFLEGTEPAEHGPATGVGAVAGFMAQGVSWILLLCSKYCGGAMPVEGEEEEEQSPSLAETLKETLDDFLDHLNPAWLDDLVNQSYDIDNNIVAGVGDGIWTGIDSTRITNNKVTLRPAGTVPYETIIFGVLLGQYFDDTYNTAGDTAGFTAEAQALTSSAVELDRDMLFLTGYGAYEWMGGNADDKEFCGQFRKFLDALRKHIDPSSDLLAPVIDMQENLDVNCSDTSKARDGWQALIRVMVRDAMGYGIVMRGANMACKDNQILSKAGCRGSSIKAVGGIWQYSNFAGLLIDFLGIRESRYLLIIWLLSFVALLFEGKRDLCIAQNRVEQSLVHGVRTVGVMGAHEMEIFDNTIKDASRYGICHMEIGEHKINFKAHGNTVTKLKGSSAFADEICSINNFSALMWVENDEGTTLMSQNHGDDEDLFGEDNRAVFVNSKVVGITANHIITEASHAFEVTAGNGLFTDNMTNKSNTVLVGGIEQAPNVIL
jgi:hypothetical protein